MLYQLSYAPLPVRIVVTVSARRPAGTPTRMSEHEHDQPLDPSTQEPAEGDRDDVLQQEQQGKGYGATGELEESEESGDE